MNRLILVAAALASTAGCAQDAPIAATDGGRNDAGRRDAGSIDGGREQDSGVDPDGGPIDAGRTDAGSGECSPTRIQRLCVRGTASPEGEVLPGGAPLMFTIFPEGCHSSACTIQERASCDASLAGTSITLTGEFCLGQDGPCVTPDCSGGGVASCSTAGSADAGRYTATLGALSLSFDIPSQLPFGGLCVELGSVGTECESSAGCGEGLTCCYPCGIPDCEFVCEPTCDPGTPECFGGCLLRP
jgi:hypothetical protein